MNNSWPDTVPILRNRDAPDGLARAYLRLFPKDKMETVSSAVALTLNTFYMLGVTYDKAKIFNVAMAYLGYMEGQDETTLKLAKLVVERRKAQIASLMERTRNACEERQLYRSSGSFRASNQRETGGNLSRGRGTKSKVTSHDGQVPIKSKIKLRRGIKVRRSRS